MKLSKRQFLKLSMGSAAAAILAPLVRPAALLARPVTLCSAYLQSDLHSHWMKLSYNDGRESRQTRRLMGAALRNLGAIRGQSVGFLFAICFDEAVQAAYQRYLATGRKPATLFGLVQMVYNDFLYPRTGVEGGRVLFTTLLAILRGRDGTARGQRAHESYLAYRRAALEYKDACRLRDNPTAIADARKRRMVCLQQWQANLKALADLYAQGELALNPTFVVRTDMLDGLELPQAPARLAQPRPRLAITKLGNQVIVSWKGQGRLQHAPTLLGPWTDTHQASPASVDAGLGNKFFRTVQ